eukprot:CAMPEP_0183813822 /NCGR_PEP_ID=MMETSP0803_2-20130417/53770_1 /TAXON_ID=195967 /ORGANISM="Crustomastix stigmata, Strain CCMP3273" /LENGTH=47 /DNA_ID= /DNA_START= /DNA_END= /DNA_ORIENTATION=
MNLKTEERQPPIDKLTSWTQEAKTMSIVESENLSAGTVPLERAIGFV